MRHTSVYVIVITCPCLKCNCRAQTYLPARSVCWLVRDRQYLHTHIHACGTYYRIVWRAPLVREFSTVIRAYRTPHNGVCKLGGWREKEKKTGSPRRRARKSRRGKNISASRGKEREREREKFRLNADAQDTRSPFSLFLPLSFFLFFYIAIFILRVTFSPTPLHLFQHLRTSMRLCTCRSMLFSREIPAGISPYFVDMVRQYGVSNCKWYLT